MSPAIPPCQQSNIVESGHIPDHYQKVEHKHGVAYMSMLLFRSLSCMLLTSCERGAQEVHDTHMTCQHK